MSTHSEKITIYQEGDGLKYVMEQRLKKNLIGQFPSHLNNCAEKFEQIERSLNKHHESVNIGAALNKAGLLTDHGSNHVQKVMKRASQIIDEKRIECLSGYEIFILLVAIHFHDIGNIFGREDHEQKVFEIMNGMDKELQLNTIDKEFIKDVAMAHGGYADEAKTDRDTIRDLRMIDYCDSIVVRPAALAAILRFADEVAEDYTRTNNYQLVKIPLENEIFHAYSNALEMSINGNTISFNYRIPYEQTQKEMLKNENTVFLYEEIKNRLEKCLRELEYCRKYSEGFIRITTLNVTISVIMSNGKRELVDNFKLRLLGYPNELKFDDFIERFDQDGAVLTNQKLKYASGEELKNKMKERAQA